MKLDPATVFTYSSLDHRIPEERILAAENQHGFRFPSAYRDFIKTLGRGSLSHILDLLSPEQTVDCTTETRLTLQNELELGDRNFRSRLNSSWSIAYCAGKWNIWWFDRIDNRLFATNDLYETSFLQGDFSESAYLKCKSESPYLKCKLNRFPKLVFHPFEQRLRYHFSPENKKPTFDEAILAIKTLNAHDYSEWIENFGQAKYFAVFYYCDFGGRLSVCEHNSMAGIGLDGDSGVHNNVFHEVLKVINDLGLDLSRIQDLS